MACIDTFPDRTLNGIFEPKLRVPSKDAALELKDSAIFLFRMPGHLGTGGHPLVEGFRRNSFEFRLFIGKSN
jgi:hypothetical protein